MKQEDNVIKAGIDNLRSRYGQVRKLRMTPKPTDYKVHIGTQENGTLCGQEYSPGNAFAVSQVDQSPRRYLEQDGLCPECKSLGMERWAA